jgi:hypothetical protein
MSVTFSNLVKDVETIEAWDLSPAERAEFDYLDWPALEAGEDSRTFVRYAGEIYLLNDFSVDWGITRGAGLPSDFEGWHGYLSDSFFSGVVIRYHHGDPETVDLATFYTS